MCEHYTESIVKPALFDGRRGEKLKSPVGLLWGSWGFKQSFLSLFPDFLLSFPAMSLIKSRALNTLAAQKREVYLLITDADTWTIGWYDRTAVKSVLKTMPHVVRPAEIGLSDAFVINAEENIAAVENLNRRRLHLVEEEMELAGLKATATASDRTIRGAIRAYLHKA